MPDLGEVTTGRVAEQRSVDAGPPGGFAPRGYAPLAERG